MVAISEVARNIVTHAKRGVFFAGLKIGVLKNSPYQPGFRLGFALCVAWAGLTRASAAIVINEIHYNPEVKTEHVEFVELFNAGSDTVDMSGWYFSDGVNFTFPAGTVLPTSGYVVVAQDPAA